MSFRRSSILNIDEWLGKCPDEEPNSIIYETDYADGVSSNKIQQILPTLEGALKKFIAALTGAGFAPELVDDRSDDFVDYINECVNTFDKHIYDEIDKICRYKDDHLKQVQSMMKDLYDQDYRQDENITLIQQCKKLKSQFGELNKSRQKRLDKFKELRDMQISHCLVLGIRAPQVRNQTDIPSEKELEDLAQAVSKLNQKEKKHREEYHQLRDSILKHIEELEYKPETDFEKSLLNEEPCYTEDHLIEMNGFHSKLEAQYITNEKKFQKLTARLNSLFERLDVDQHERNALLQEYTSCKPSVMALMELEIERFEELKRQNIGKFIAKLKDELIVEYERCCESQEQQDNFFALSTVSGECNEELLELYEGEYERIKNFYQNNYDILENFHKWRAMWKELIEIELKANDPNRFNNRGGQLLHEERKRKGLQKALPKLEQELTTLCEKYSANNDGNKFKVYATELGEFIAGCWDELNTAKEEEKRQRQRAKMTTTTTSTNNVRKPLQSQVLLKRTPTKRAAGAGITPTPTKLKCQRSNLGTPANNTYRSNLALSGSCTKSTQKNLFPRDNITNRCQPPSAGSTKSNIPVASGNNVSQRHKNISNSNGSDMSTLSLSEKEFEDLITACPTSAKKTRF